MSDFAHKIIKSRIVLKGMSDFRIYNVVLVIKHIQISHKIGQIRTLNSAEVQDFAHYKIV